MEWTPESLTEEVKVIIHSVPAERGEMHTHSTRKHTHTVSTCTHTCTQRAREMVWRDVVLHTSLFSVSIALISISLILFSFTHLSTGRNVQTTSLISTLFGQSVSMGDSPSVFL